jgi:hypothetical protein
LTYLSSNEDYQPSKDRAKVDAPIPATHVPDQY